MWCGDISLLTSSTLSASLSSSSQTVVGWVLTSWLSSWIIDEWWPLVHLIPLMVKIRQMKTCVLNTDYCHLFHQCHGMPSNAIIPHDIARKAQNMSNNRFSMPPHVSKKRLTTMQHQRWHRRKLTPRLWAQQQDPVPAIDSVHSTTILFVIFKSS